MEASALPILTESNLTTPDPSTPKRKRGGQKDNKKALKLGFYARHLRPSEIRDLQEISTTSLQEEIAMQRIVARRIVECFEKAQRPAEVVHLARTLSSVVNSVCRLVLIQNMLAGLNSESEVTFLEALEAVHRQLNIDGCNPPPEQAQAPGEHN